MSELFKAALAGAWTWVITYVFPSALAIGLAAAAMGVLEPNSRVVASVQGWTPGYRSVAALAIAVLMAMVLAGLNNGLHRILEGYVLLPRFKRVWDWMCGRQLRRKKKLVAAAESVTHAPLRAALLLERARDYPDDDQQIGPTRYANSVRALETYAVSRFLLDSQYLWGQLTACAPEPARTAETDARNFVDFLVNNLFVFWALTLGSVTMAAVERDGRWLLLAIAFGVTSFVWRRLLLGAVRSWRSAVRAMVDLGRAPLAAALKLQLPASMSGEREMWRTLVWALRDQHADSETALERFRLGEQ